MTSTDPQGRERGRGEERRGEEDKEVFSLKGLLMGVAALNQLLCKNLRASTAHARRAEFIKIVIYF